jgi:Protein of unknown function (DUF3489)
MSKKPIPLPPPTEPEKGREIAEGHSRVICHIGGTRYALDFWSSACELNPTDAVVRPFPSGKLPIIPKVASELPCISPPSGVIHVMTAKRAAQRTTTMTTFTIDADNHITLHHTPEEAAATSANPFDTFTSQQEFAELAKSWPATRLVAIWNSLPGVQPIQKFKDHQVAATRIWKRLEGLAASAPPQPAQPAKPKSAHHAKGGAQAPTAAPAKRKAPPEATAGKNAKQAEARQIAASRPGSKTAQVVAMLRRKNGATLAEIMQTMGWQKHTVRGFMAGAMKKAGHTVESFKPDGGVRTYRIK